MYDNRFKSPIEIRSPRPIYLMISLQFIYHCMLPHIESKIRQSNTNIYCPLPILWGWYHISLEWYTGRSQYFLRAIWVQIQFHVFICELFKKMSKKLNTCRSSVLPVQLHRIQDARNTWIHEKKYLRQINKYSGKNSPEKTRRKLLIYYKMKWYLVCCFESIWLPILLDWQE